MSTSIAEGVRHCTSTADKRSGLDLYIDYKIKKLVMLGMVLGMTLAAIGDRIKKLFDSGSSNNIHIENNMTVK